MNFFKFIRNHRLVKEKSNKIKKITSDIPSIKHAIEQPVEISFEADSIVSISENNFLDTTTPLAIAMYKNNLKLLIEYTKQRGFVDKFMLVRDDDNFPYDWEWRVSSKNTCIEKINSYLSYMLRQSIARKNLGIDDDSFWIPVDEKLFNEEMSKIDKMLGSVFMPAKFRSTKHFTVNTPLAYTGEYNCVKANRNFTIIDDIGIFLKSGYAYSADYRDAYLDITHESLEISDNAIVLISEDKYSNVMSDTIIAEQLKKRCVIVYRGEEAVAVNMLLSELGVLPARPGNIYHIYDEEINEILENSMKKLCVLHDIEYAKGHGNLLGKGGHFSDLYDGYNHDFEKAQEEFLTYLLSKFPQASSLINYHLYRDSSVAEEFINLVGVDNCLSVIEEYNRMVKDRFEITFQQYKNDREKISLAISVIFKETVKLIRLFYANEQDNTLSIDARYQLQDLIRLFYHSFTVDEQLKAANKICEIFDKKYELDNDNSNSITI